MADQYVTDMPKALHNHIKNVAIIGATGRSGKFILQELLAKSNFNVTAIQRLASSGQIPDGVKVVKAEYGGESDDAELVEALRGQEALVITMSVMAPRDTVARISRAAATAGVSYVMPNWMGHDPSQTQLLKDVGFLEARDKLEELFQSFPNTAYFFLACGFWYEFSLGGGEIRFGFDFVNKSFTWFDDGEVKQNVTTWPQCGRAIASLLSLKILPDDEHDTSPTLSRFRNKAVYVSSFRLSQRDMFESVKRVTGTSDSDWTIKHDKAERRYTESAAELSKGNFTVSHLVVRMYSRMFYPSAEGDYESTRGLDNELLGLPQEDLDEWTRVAVQIGESDMEYARPRH